jgi:hypothetical protein
MARREKWEWFGHSGHLVVGRQCQFHLCTLVGNFLVSTVGEYVPPSGTTEEFEEIGCDRLYETMVFKTTGDRCTSQECNCGMPEVKWSELDFDGYNQAGSATVGHMKMCTKWSRRRVRDDVG